jgi:hypothetical protein
MAFYTCSSLASIDVDEANAAYASESGVLFNKDKTTLICCPGGKTGEYAVPASVASIGYYAFSHCTGLTSVVIPNSVVTIDDYAFFSCRSLTSVVIPHSVATIGEWAFCYCSSLTSVVIGNSVATIGWHAFRYCSSLTEVVIGSSVSRIGDYAFFGCSALTSVTNLCATPQIFITNYHAFYGISLNEVALYVPVASVEAYQAAPVWQDFGRIEGVESTGLDDWEVAGVAVFPNPFVGALRITGAAGSRLTVVGMDGVQVHRQSVAGADEWLPVGHLPAGGYLVRVEKDGVVKVMRVLKR